MDFSLQRVQERLRHHDAASFTLPGARRAAVAILLRFGDASVAEDGPHCVLMRRVTHAQDRWSGQVSLPGGREEESDADLVATAVRESREEVGLDLAGEARLLGGLAPLPAIAKGRILPMTIHPFVFAETAPREPVVGPEAARAFWFPLRAAARGDLDDTFLYKAGPVPIPFPCWRHDGEIIWGLTYRILRDFLAAVGVGQ